ncbi:MAG TPA: hypothetical protein VF173_32350 [Thermoanaerobaculia bacterium]|nr:hypothetical protein [Thermoanaerobaculia bacterium]
MILFFPIGAFVGGLIWVVRSLLGAKNAAQAPGAVRRTRGTPVALFQTLSFLFVYLPFALWAAFEVGGATSVLWGFATFVVVAVAVCWAPYWLAWRVLGPLGLPALGRAVLWLAPSSALEKFQGNLEVFSAAYGGRPKLKRWKATFWTFFAAALRGEAEGDLQRVEQLLELMEGRSPRQLPRRLRSQGVELLAWPAMDAGNWEEAGRRLALGRGRGVRLLRRLEVAFAAPEAGASSPVLLWFLWLIAPERRRTLPLVRSALAPKPPRAPRIAVAAMARAGESVWSRHLGLLADAGAGRPISAVSVEALAEDWDAVLGRDCYLRLLRRAAELGVTGVQAAAETLRPAIEAELEDLAVAVEGLWPEPSHPDGLAAQVRRRRLDRLFAAVQAEVDPFRGNNFQSFPRQLDTPFSEMERWLRFRLSLRQLLASDPGALATAWHNGLRLAACNWPVFILRTYGQEAQWACREMSAWCEPLARAVGDQEIVKLSHGNSRIGRSFLG